MTSTEELEAVLREAEASALQHERIKIMAMAAMRYLAGMPCGHCGGGIECGCERKDGDDE